MHVEPVKNLLLIAKSGGIHQKRKCMCICVVPLLEFICQKLR